MISWSVKSHPKARPSCRPEEKLLRAIFGEKAGDVKDTSLRVPPGVEGIVIDAKVFSRRGVEKDDRTREIEDEEIAQLEKDRDDELGVIDEVVRAQLTDMLAGKKVYAPLKKGKKVLIANGAKIDAKVLAKISLAHLEGIVLKDADHTQQVHEALERYRDQRELCRLAFEQQVSRYERGDDLPPGVIKMVKIYVAMKRKLSVGDKMAGRHGNKGVVSRILPVEDLPYFENGKPVDMVLNPLGVPSRMNVGQILEIHLGRAAKGLGDQVTELLESEKLKALRDKMKRVFSNAADQ